MTFLSLYQMKMDPSVYKYSRWEISLLLDRWIIPVLHMLCEWGAIWRKQFLE